jgi:hypothetical protein
MVISKPHIYKDNEKWVITDMDNFKRHEFSDFELVKNWFVFREASTLRQQLLKERNGKRFYAKRKKKL